MPLKIATTYSEPICINVNLFTYINRKKLSHQDEVN